MSPELLNVIELLIVLVGGVWGTAALMAYLDRRAARKAAGK